MNSPLQKENFIQSTEAASRYGFTNDHVASLCRRGTVEGKLIAGRIWYVKEESLTLYIQKVQAEKDARKQKLSEQFKREATVRADVQPKAVAPEPAPVPVQGSTLKSPELRSNLFIPARSTFFSLAVRPAFAVALAMVITLGASYQVHLRSTTDNLVASVAKAPAENPLAFMQYFPGELAKNSLALYNGTFGVAAQKYVDGVYALGNVLGEALTGSGRTVAVAVQSASKLLAQSRRSEVGTPTEASGKSVFISRIAFNLSFKLPNLPPPSLHPTYLSAVAAVAPPDFVGGAIDAVNIVGEQVAFLQYLPDAMIDTTLAGEKAVGHVIVSSAKLLAQKSSGLLSAPKDVAAGQTFVQGVLPPPADLSAVVANVQQRLAQAQVIPQAITVVEEVTPQVTAAAPNFARMIISGVTGAVVALTAQASSAFATLTHSVSAGYHGLALWYTQSTQRIQQRFAQDTTTVQSPAFTVPAQTLPAAQPQVAVDTPAKPAAQKSVALEGSTLKSPVLRSNLENAKPAPLADYVTQDALTAQLQQMSNSLRSLIYTNSSAGVLVPQYIAAGGNGGGNPYAASSRISQLSGVAITNSTIDTASIPDLSGSYLSLAGGTVTGSIHDTNLTSTSTFDGNVQISGTLKLGLHSAYLSESGLTAAGSSFTIGTAADNGMLALQSLGRVGVSSSTPWGVLSVEHNGANAGMPIFVVASSSVPNPFLLVDYHGNVGVGTSSPSDVFAVNGPIYLADVAPASTNNRLYSNSGSLYWAGNLVAGGSVGNWTTDGTNAWRATGSVGIGTASPAYKLDVAGNGHFTGLVDADHFVATSSSVASIFNGGFQANASSTLQNFTALNSTSTNATSTSFFATTASSTNLFAQLATFGAAVANSLTLNSPLGVASGGTGQNSSAWNGLGAINAGVWSALSTTSMNASITGNAGTATTLQTARNINGVSFNGSANITVASTTLLGDSNTFSGTDTFSNLITGSISGNAATVTTNANLSGVVISSGNTTSYAATAGANTVLGNGTGATAAPTFIATSSLFVWNGTGNVVRDTSPSFTTPALGTPSALVGTNITGTGASFTAGKATILATARTIAGVSFDGSANITIPSTGLSDTANIAYLNAGNAFTNAGNNTFVGSLGIGTTTPWAKLSIATAFGDTGATQMLFAIASSTGGTATSTLFSVSNTGNITEGTATATTTMNGGLFVTGTADVENSILGPLSFANDAGNGLAWMNLPIVSATNGTAESYSANIAGSPILTVYGTSNGSGGVSSYGVGVGSTTPYGEFGIQANNGTNYPGNLLFTVGSSTASAITTLFSVTNAGLASTTALRISNSTTLEAVKNCNGATNALGTDVNGVVQCDAGVSDQRLKSNITTLDGSMGLSLLDQLNPVSYNWKDPSVYGASTSTQYGFIAQEAAMVAPTLVGITNPTALTPDKTYFFNYQGLEAIIVKAVQDIANLSDAFKARLTAWFGAANNGIHDLYANTFHTQKLCVADNSGAETCITKAQLDQLLANTGSSQTSSSNNQNSNNSGSDSSSTTASTPDTTPPTITVTGNNPATVNIGTTYVDLGATVSDNVNQNLGYQVSVDGGATTTPDQLVVNTSTTTTHVITYSATDQAGNVGTATRTVTVVDPNTAATTP